MNLLKRYLSIDIFEKVINELEKTINSNKYHEEYTENNNFYYYIIIESYNNIEKINTFFEGTNWRKTNVKDYWMRTDPPRAENQFRREICLAKGKHRNSIPQFTYYQDGKRKDHHKFTIEPSHIVKQYVIDFFGLDSIDMLEAYVFPLATTLYE